MPEVLALAHFFADPGDIFRRLAGLESPVLLASGGDHPAGRWDIIAAEPDGERSRIVGSDCTEMEIREVFAELQQLGAAAQTDSAPDKLPFYGGHIGFMSYELGRRLHGLPPAPGAALPLAALHFYPWAIVQDRHERRAYLVCERGQRAALVPRVEALLQQPAPDDHAFGLQEPFTPAWDLQEYTAVFERVKAYIRSGDCYQINIGQPFTARFRGSLFDAYQQLTPLAQAPFSAFLPLTDGNALLSLSPERFLTIDRGRVETRPIKGTRPRFSDPWLDRRAAQELQSSEKERAENLMIVDLLRNDIGRFCRPGSVAVDALFSLESYATVHHLVSVVSGELQDDCQPLQLLLGCMPGGSITGAPKRRAMQIIDELEPAPRGAWC
ncbi:MAG: anthranilate synthase component I family protein, partial [Gammaproteobacteria bacterium]|nr:anthranilate synthase component I family protein [Gammaproteobacteria bacterium]